MTTPGYLDAVNNDLIRNLRPAAAATRAAYSRTRRPWTPGYRALARASAAAKLAGFNSYHPNDTSHVVLLEGVGAAAAATPATYDIPASALALLWSNIPLTTPLTNCTDYLNAVCVIYPNRDRTNGVLLERIATGGATVNRPFWRIDDSNTISICSAFAAGPLYSDVPFQWTIELQFPTTTAVPASATGDVVVMWEPTGVDRTTLSVMDFLAAGNTAETGNIVLDRQQG